jgi:hypothetical protein
MIHYVNLSFKILDKNTVCSIVPHLLNATSVVSGRVFGVTYKDITMNAVLCSAGISQVIRLSVL